jgi:steroid delta-isomerase-like uncharacterized protein
MRIPNWHLSWIATKAIAVTTLFALIACRAGTDRPVTEQQAQAIASRYLEARNTPNLDLLDEIYAPDVVVHDAGAPEDIHGLDALRTYYEGSHAGFPDFEARFDEVLVAEDQIIYRWTVEGTHTGTLRGFPPTGKHVTFSGVAIDRIEEGKIVEEWVYYDTLDLLQQLGFTLVPPGSEDPSA